MADSRPVSSGDPIGQLPSFSASWLNNVSKMLRWFNRNVASGESSGGSTGLENGTGPVRVKNLTGHDLLRGHYVQLGDYLLDTVNHRQHWYKGNLYDSGTDGQIAVLTKAVATGATYTVEARIIGRCTARVNVTDITHRFCKLVSGDYKFASSATIDSANVTILSTNLIVGTGEQEVAIVIGGGGGGSGSKKTAVVKSTGTIAAAAGTPVTTSAFTIVKGDTGFSTIENRANVEISIDTEMPVLEIDGDMVIINAWCTG